MNSSLPDVSPLGPVPIIGAKRYKTWSQIVGAYFIIDVAMPSPMMPRNGPAPVMFVTDGNLCFASTVNLCGAMAMEPGGPPPHCVVGIGYEVSGGGEKAEHHLIRTRDLSPCPDVICHLAPMCGLKR